MINKNAMFKPLTLKEKTNINPNDKKENDKGIPITPVPDDAPQEAPQHFSLGKPSLIWNYLDEKKQLLQQVCRFEKENGKEDRPRTYREFESGLRRWYWAGLDVPRPLYGLDRLADRPNAPVLLCEGEKAADAGKNLFSDYVAITSPNGSQAPENANWTPVANRQIVIWPDQDEAGRKYAADSAQLALKAGAISVSIVNVPETFPEKWDLADNLPPNVTIDDLRRMINEAQIVLPSIDPLDDLIKRAKADPGEAFKPEVIDALLNLKLNDRPAFESLRAKLREAKIRVGELDKLIRELDGQDASCGDDDLNQADILIDLADAAEYFHTPDDLAYAHFDVKDHRETWPVRHKGFRRWLTRRYHQEMGKAPNAEALNAALNTIEAKAYYEAPKQEAFLRVGRLGENIYIDLCDELWRVIEISPTGWRILDSSPVRFRRTAGMLPLPLPKKGGSINTLRKFINVKGENDFVLTVSWLLAGLRDTGPYPVLGISGEQGSAKSTFTKIMKMTIDPNAAPLRALPSEDDSLFIAANNGYILAFDNLSFISALIADTLCRLSTGGGHAKRQLYTDLDEVLFNVMRAIILNGITDVITRPDLADRTLVLTLLPIPDEQRRPEKEFLAEFNAALPEILGALLDAVSYGLKALPTTQLKTLPRMADFALWATACEGAFGWPSGTFIEAYRANRDILIDSVLDANPVASAVLSLMDIGGTWTGTSGELLDECGKIVGESVERSKLWPKSPRGMVEHLDRAATFLRQRGIEISKYRNTDKNRTRIVTISWAGNNPKDSSSGSSGQSEPAVSNTETRTKADDPDDYSGTATAEPESEDRIIGFDEMDMKNREYDANGKLIMPSTDKDRPL